MVDEVLHRRLRNTDSTKNGGDLRCSEKVKSHCSTSGSRRTTRASTDMKMLLDTRIR